MKTKKGVSEIITITLIIVITVILAGMFFAWTKNTTRERLDQTTAELKVANDLECSNAEFYVDSCTIYSTTKTIRLTLVNNSTLKLFNLNLIINGDVSGNFNKIVSSGETAYLSTDTNFTVNRGSQNDLADIDISEITNITLTNGTCPKEILDISGCTIVNALWPPTATIGSGTHYLEQHVSLLSEGATIYYTLDGSDPTTDSNVYSTALIMPLDTNTTLKAIAAAEGYVTSDINTWVYNITHTLSAPRANPVAGTYHGTTDVTLSAEPGATIYYYPRGMSVPEIYTSPLVLTPYHPLSNLAAYATKEGYGQSATIIALYDILRSNDNTISMFNFFKNKLFDVNGTIDNDANTITAELPAGADVTELTPTITVHRDATVNPASGVKNDFTNPVEYTVTAGDETKRTYTVTVTVAAGSSNTVVYDVSSEFMTITLSPDIDLTTFGAQIIVYDVDAKAFITTDIGRTTTEMVNAAPSPYEISAETLEFIGFDIGGFVEAYGKRKISHFDIVNNKKVVLATIPVDDITVNSKSVKK